MSTISRFDNRFPDGQYSLVSFLFAVLLTVPPCPAICKCGGARALRAMWSRRHCTIKWPCHFTSALSYLVGTMSIIYCVELPKLVEAPTVSNVTCTQLDVSWLPWSASLDIGSETISITSYSWVNRLCNSDLQISPHERRLFISTEFIFLPKIANSSLLYSPD